MRLRTLASHGSNSFCLFGARNATALRRARKVSHCGNGRFITTRFHTLARPLLRHQPNPSSTQSLEQAMEWQQNFSRALAASDIISTVRVLESFGGVWQRMPSFLPDDRLRDLGRTCDELGLGRVPRLQRNCFRSFFYHLALIFRATRHYPYMALVGFYHLPSYISCLTAMWGISPNPHTVQFTLTTCPTWADRLRSCSFYPIRTNDIKLQPRRQGSPYRKLNANFHRDGHHTGAAARCGPTPKI